MQRDVKIGIAIGVLLIALVAIFMWTRRDVPQPLMPAGYEAARTQLPPAEEPVAPLGLDSDDDLLGPPVISASEVPMPARPGAIRQTSGTSFEPPRGDTASVGTVLPRQAPAGQPPTGMPPPAIAPRKHTVAANESLSKIAARYYGTGTKANIERIHNANIAIIGPDANKLKVGMTLIIPNIRASSALVPVAIRATTPQPSAVQKHTVALGESLSKIAARYYGTGTKANIDRIHTANRDVIGSDANKIKKGMVLTIPPKE